MIHSELHIESTQGQAFYRFFNAGEFSFFSTEEFSAGRCVEKQISDFDSGSVGMRYRRNLCQHLLTFSLHLPGELVFCHLRPGLQGQAGDRTDTGQSFASKPQTGNRLQIRQFTNLAGGVPAQGQREILFQNPCTVVPDRINLTPPCSISTSRRVASESRLFSNSSFTTRQDALPPLQLRFGSPGADLAG